MSVDAVSVPTLSTERLVMRGFAESDFPAYAAMMADPETTRHLGDGRALSPADAWRQMAMFAGHWVLRGFGVWAVEERATGAFVGRVGCFQPHGWPDFELAYTIARPCWGRGYASEAARAALAYARNELGRDRVISVIRPGNARSIRVAEGLGAVREGEVEFYGAPAAIYVYPAPTR